MQHLFMILVICVLCLFFSFSRCLLIVRDHLVTFIFTLNLKSLSHKTDRKDQGKYLSRLKDSKQCIEFGVGLSQSSSIFCRQIKFLQDFCLQLSSSLLFNFFSIVTVRFSLFCLFILIFQSWMNLPFNYCSNTILKESLCPELPF